MSPSTENQYRLFIPSPTLSFRDARRAGPETMNISFDPGSAESVFLGSGLAGVARAPE
jgi:hypothetical protein